MKIVILDGHAINPGDLSWEPLQSLGNLEVFDGIEDSRRIEKSLYALPGNQGENQVCIIVNAKDAREARSRALEKVLDLRSRSRVVKVEDEVFVIEIPTLKPPYFSNP